MSDFWLNKIREAHGQQPAPPRQPQAGLTPTGAPWWRHPTYTQPQQPAAVPEADPGVPVTTPPARAKSAGETEPCPSCNSGNYFRPEANVRKSCFDCGWPVQNSTQGTAIANNSSAPVKKSLREAKGAGYRPDVIIGRM